MEPPLSKKYVQLYVIEIIEAFIAVFVIRLAINVKIDFTKICLESLGIGLITLILEQYSSDYANNIRQGILFTVGASLINRQIPATST